MTQIIINQKSIKKNSAFWSNRHLFFSDSAWLFPIGINNTFLFEILQQVLSTKQEEESFASRKVSVITEPKSLRETPSFFSRLWHTCKHQLQFVRYVKNYLNTRIDLKCFVLFQDISNLLIHFIKYTWDLRKHKDQICFSSAQHTLTEQSLTVRGWCRFWNSSRKMYEMIDETHRC